MASPASIPQKESSVAQIELPFTYIFVVTDLCLRYLLLVLWRVSFISSAWFWVGQICVVSIPLLALINNRRNHLSRKYNISPNSLGIKNAAHWILVTFILMLHGGVQTFERVGFRTHWLHVTVATLLSMFYAIYILSIAVGSLRDELPDTQEKALSPQEIIDENDRLLIHLKTEIATFERRVESYTIESTLIGGIAFSAFVTIISSEKAQLHGVANFLAYVSSMFSALLTREFQ